MPLVFLAYVALALGCALGALAPPAAVPGIVGAALVAAVVAGLRRDARAVGLTLTIAAGVLDVRAEQRAVVACRADAVARGVVAVTLIDDARAGSKATAIANACGVPVVLSIVRGTAMAGAHVRVRGLVVAGLRGLLVRDAQLEPLGGGSALAAWRARVGREVDALYGPEAPLVRALVIADQADIPRDVRDRFADAGLVHLLSVSGLHVSLVATALELLLVAARVSRQRAAIASVVAVACYVLMIGAPAPAVRAGAMLAAHLGSRLLQRPTSPWAVLAIGGVLPLVTNPLAIVDAGYQLSMAGMASLVGGRAVAKRAFAGRLDGWRLGTARELTVSAVASVVTAPIVVWWFGRVSIIGPLANLAAAPIVGALQPALFLAVVLAPVRPLARLVADAGRLLLHLLDLVARAAAAVPHASLSVGTSMATTVLTAMAATALLAACVARRPERRSQAGIASVACVVVAIWWPVLPRGASGVVELHMLDVGQGDAIAIRTPRGRWVLVDAGRVWRGGDAGRSTIIPFLRHAGGDVAAFILSHPHADHVGGAASVLSALRPALYWDAAFALGSDVYRASLDSARTVGVPWRRVHPNDSLDVDGVVFRVLAPDSTWTATLDDPNLASVIVSVRYGAVRFLLVGDAEAPEERWLLGRVAAGDLAPDALRADVLKVAHHGSRTSSTAAFLDAVRPRLGLVSVGAGNSYQLPNDDVLRRLRDYGAEVLRTDEWGAIVVRSDGRTLTVDAGGESWRVGSHTR
jgi:competence protein ComEC